MTRKRNTISYRAAVGIAFAAAFMLTWGSFVQMADVTPFAATHFAVPIVGVIGTALARLRPNGMARAMFATFLSQILILGAALILLLSRKPEVTTWTLPEWRRLGGNMFFCVLFAVSGLLFRKAGREEMTHGMM